MFHVLAAAQEKGGLAVVLPPPYEIFWSAVVLLVVLLLVGRFALPRIYRVMDERAAKIEEGLGAAEKAKADQAAAARERDAILRDANAEAQDEANRILEVAQRQILAERQAAQISLRAEVGLLASELAEKIIGEQLRDTALTSRVVDRFLDELEEDTNAARDGAR